jgi:transposase-like protein
MIKRMAGPEAISATKLSKEVGVSQNSLSRWLREARTLGPMGRHKKQREGGAKSPHRWSAEEKLRIVLEAARLSEEELGAFLRREGLHEAQLKEWMESATAALSDTTKRRKAKPSPEVKRIKELERDLRRKEKALAELAALLALKKKVEEIWGDGADDTDTRSGT